MRQPVIDETLARELERYRGRWVALHERKVVAEGDSPADVLRKARQQHVTDPTIYRVPAHPERLTLL